MPKITLEFPNAETHRFTINWDNDIQESQFEIAGQELVEIARRLRNLRLSKQLDPNLKIVEQQPSSPNPQLPAPAPAPANVPLNGQVQNQGVEQVLEKVTGALERFGQRLDALEKPRNTVTLQEAPA